MATSQLIKVTEATYLDGYRIRLTFSDGISGIVDLEKEIWGEVFEPLKELTYFKNFTRDRWTIVWDCGADFAPEFLHQLTLQQNELTVKISPD